MKADKVPLKLAFSLLRRYLAGNCMDGVTMWKGRHDRMTHAKECRSLVARELWFTGCLVRSMTLLTLVKLVPILQSCKYTTMVSFLHCNSSKMQH